MIGTLSTSHQVAQPGDSTLELTVSPLKRHVASAENLCQMSLLLHQLRLHSRQQDHRTTTMERDRTVPGVEPPLEFQTPTGVMLPTHAVIGTKSTKSQVAPHGGGTQAKMTSRHGKDVVTVNSISV